MLYSGISRNTKKKKTKVETISVVYEGVSANGLTHTVRLPDGSLRAVEECQLQDHLQPSFTNIPSTPLDYLNEVGKGISQEEAQRLARPTTLSPAQQELLSWHHRLYHLSFPMIFKLARLGFLPKTLLKCEKTVPICLECQFGKGHRRPWRSKGKKSGTIQKKKEVEPGDGVSADQIVSAQPGLVPQMSGFLTKDRIWGATTFVDHVSDYVYVHLMTDFTIEETLAAKKAFERIFTLAGRTVKAYRADNGRFADKKWHEDCNLLKQALTFCGVGNHRQNGKIEAKNKYLTLTARTLLLQGMRLWPEMISTYFWPFALKAAAERHNTLHVDDDGMTPESKLYGIKAEEIPVRNYHPLFCPVFVLDHRLHSAGGSIPKWEPRMRCGVYLGHSPLHAGNVALVFNPRTGRVSPAYHVVFDDGFTTVPYMKAAKLPPNWEDLVKNSAEIATIEKYELADEWIKEEIVVEQESDADQSKITDPFAIGPAPVDSKLSEPQATNSQGAGSLLPSEGAKSSKRARLKDKKTADNSQSSKRPKLNSNNEAKTSTASLDQSVVSAGAEQNQLEMPKIIDLSTAGYRRSARLAEKRNKPDNRATVNLTCHGVKIMAVSLFTAMSTVGTISMPDHNQLDKNNEWGKPTNPRAIPGQRILGRDHTGEDRHYENNWNYRTAVGMLTYLQGNSRPEIAVHVHQCARFSINPKRSHEAAILNIGRYLLGSREKGIIYRPNKTKGLECYVDADFAGGWQLADAESADNVLSRTGYVLMYAGCPIHWVSKLQTEIALSTAEAEYIALSQSLREVIPLMSMMKELQSAFPIEIQNPNFNCTVHEDNQSCISMATKQKFSPRTKHIALKYHHFRSYVNSKKINIQYIDTKQQVADGLTKPLGTELFFNIRKMLCGW